MKEGGAKEFRMIIGYELLMLMERNEDLPLPNIHRLSSVMDEYYHRESMFDYVIDEYSDRGFDATKYKWTSSPDYWRTHIRDLSDYMIEESKIYFDFIRDDGKLTGVWKFMNKGEWEKVRKWDNNSIATRIDNHNKKVEDTSLRWKTDLPKIGDVKKIS